MRKCHWSEFLVSAVCLFLMSCSNPPPTIPGIYIAARKDGMFLVEATDGGVTCRQLDEVKQLRHKVHTISIADAPVGNGCIDWLGECSNLESLDLSGTSVTCREIRALVNCHKLEQLVLDRTQIGHECIESIRQTKAKEISLIETAFGSDDADSLIAEGRTINWCRPMFGNDRDLASDLKSRGALLRVGWRETGPGIEGRMLSKPVKMYYWITFSDKWQDRDGEDLFARMERLPFLSQAVVKGKPCDGKLGERLASLSRLNSVRIESEVDVDTAKVIASARSIESITIKGTFLDEAERAKLRTASQKVKIED